MSAKAVSPWQVELIITGGGLSAGERRAISRDGARGLLRRIGPGRWVRQDEVEALSDEERHLVALRALAASARDPVLFSHWSAAVLLGLPVLRERLDGPHITRQADEQRHHVGVTDHLFAVTDAEVVRVHDLLLTGIGRTVVDLAGAAPLEEGVIAADFAMASGVPRAVLEAAVGLAGPRRASRRIHEAVAFAHAGAESPAESRARVTAWRIGVEVPELQHPVVLTDGRSVFLDIWFPRARAALEVDGDSKYLDRSMARNGPGAAIVAEKRREDEVRLQVRGFGRIGWKQSASVALLKPVLNAIGVHTLAVRPGFDEWCAAAQGGRPRRARRLLG